MDRKNIDERNQKAKIYYSSDMIDGQKTLDFIGMIIEDSKKIEYHEGEYIAYIYLVLYYATHNSKEAASKTLYKISSLLDEYKLGESFELLFHRAKAFYSNECLGNYSSGLDHLEEAIVIAERIDDQEALLKLEATIAVVNHMLGNDEIAEVYMKKIIPNAEKGKNEQFIQNSYHNYATILYELGRLEEALDYCKKSLKLLENESAPKLLWVNAGLMGRIYGKLKQHQEGLQVIDDVIAKTGTSDTHYYLYMILTKVNLLEDLSQYDSAIQVLEENLSLIEVLDHEYIKGDFYQLYSGVLKEVGRYKEAYEALMKFNTLYKKRTEQETNKKIYNLTVKEHEFALERLEKIAQMGRDLASSNSLEELLGDVRTKLGKDFNIDGIGIGTYKNKSICYDHFYANDEPIETSKISLSDPNSLAAWAIRNKKEILISNLIEEAKYYVKDGYAEVFSKNETDDSRIRSIMYAPLIVKEEVVGVFTIQSNALNAFDTSKFEIFKIISTYVAIAIKNINQARQLELLSITDALTGIYNRRGFNIFFQNEVTEKKNISRIALIMIDLDHFKKVNDRFGHMSGDEVLKTLTKLISSLLDKDDCFARIGGEEFGIFLLNQSEEQARLKAEAIRQMIENSHIIIEQEPLSITVSIGVCFSQFSNYIMLNDLYSRADRALYHAKESGRNKVIACLDLEKNQ